MLALSRRMPYWPIGMAALLFCFAGLVPFGHAQGQNRAEEGIFVTVSNPITDQVVQQIKLKIKDATDRQKRILSVVVFDFNPMGLPARTTSFGACSDLADYIRALSLGQVTGTRPRTVAYLHHEVTGHTVLPVLACGEIVMSAEKEDPTSRPRAKLGNVTRDLESTFTKSAESAYQAVAERWASPDVILRMIDPQTSLRKVSTPQGTRFWSLERIEAKKKMKEVFTVHPGIPSGLEPGVSLFDAVQCRTELGLCQVNLNSRADLALAMKLPATALREDWLVGKTIVPWRIDVVGAIDKGRLESLRRRIESALSKNANLLIFQLESDAGDTTFVASLANWIRGLKTDSGNPVRTIAYVPSGKTLGAAAFLALACDEVVLGKDSVLADFNYMKNESEDLLKIRQEMLIPLAKQQGYPPALFKAALDPKAVVHQVRSRVDANVETFLSEAEFRADQNEKTPRWNETARITAPAEGGFLKIDADMAHRARVTRSAHVDSLDQLYHQYQIASEQVRISRDDILDRLAEFFRDPLVNFFLVMLGIMGLILEVKLPGTTLPGTVAAISFVLFFWAHSFVGEFTMLAVMLFLLGLVLIGTEIFLIPGFGFTGLAGVLSIITSLVLVTLESVPRSGNDWARVGTTVTAFGGSVVAAILGAFVLAYFLPHLPFFNRLVLKPPGEDDEPSEAGAGPTPVSPDLLGAIGVAVTPLRPAGKIELDQAFLDVVAEGDYVQPGGRVRIVEIEGNRIVVQQVY